MNKHRAPFLALASALRCLGVVLALAAFAAGVSGPAAAQAVVVMVNGDPITSYDIDQRAKFTQLVNHKAPARKDVIDELIDEKLKVQVGRRYKLEITDGEVDSSFAEMAKRMNLSPEQLTQTLERGGVDAGTLKARIRADMVWQQIVRGKFQSSFQFREKDILAAVKKDEKDKDASDKVTAVEYVLRPILFLVPKRAPQSTIDARRNEAEALRNRFQNCDQGLRFVGGLKDIAIREPIVKSSADLLPELHEMLERTGVGHLTNPETTPNGIEVFAICEKRETKTDAPAVRQVRQEMFKEQFQAKSKRFLDQLRRQALIEMK